MESFRSLFVFMVLGVFFAQGSSVQTEAWKAALEKAPDYPEGVFMGRGIVIPAGGECYLVNAWVNVNMLRQTGCQLPIEIWYIGEEEVVPYLMERFEELEVTFCDVTKAFDYPIKGWEVKVHAIVASRFQEVLLLDADNVALSDPEYLFSCAEYLETGALFWPDKAFLVEEMALWEVLELAPRCLREQESGQLVLDKSKVWRALQLCMHLNKESAFYYQHIYGDKDAFQLSWLVTETPYHMVPHLMGLIYQTKSLVRRPNTFLQRDCEGEPLFCHTAIRNWWERSHFKCMWNFYSLPNWNITHRNPSYPHRAPMHPFKERFGDVEKICLYYLRQVKTDIPLFENGLNN